MKVIASKNLDRIIGLLPFFILFLAAVIGIKSEIDLFSWLNSSDSPSSANQTHVIRK